MLVVVPFRDSSTISPVDENLRSTIFPVLQIRLDRLRVPILILPQPPPLLPQLPLPRPRRLQVPCRLLHNRLPLSLRAALKALAAGEAEGRSTAGVELHIFAEDGLGTTPGLVSVAQYMNQNRLIMRLFGSNPTSQW